MCMTVTAEEGGELCCKDVGRLVNILSNQLKRHFLVPVEDNGLTMLQRHMLHFIIMASMHKEIYQKDVEAEFHIRRSTATGMMQLLERNGFICRESVERDMRLKRIVPTKKALALREGMLEDIRHVEERMLEGVGEEELSICTRTLARMVKNLSCEEQDCRDRECRLRGDGDACLEAGAGSAAEKTGEIKDDIKENAEGGNHEQKTV